jgi:F-type H+-transporting ATPase subunit b
MTINFSLVGAAFAQESHSEGEAEHATTTETGAAHGGEHEVAFPPFDPSLFPSQILWLVITFGVFYLLMNRIIIPRIGGILETRRDRISQDLDEAQRLKDESDAAYAAYEHELAEARERAHAIGQEAREKAKAEADAKREKVEAELAGKLAEAETKIGAIKQKALAEVDGIANSTASAIVSRLLGSTVPATAISRAVSAVAKGARDEL